MKKMVGILLLMCFAVFGQQPRQQQIEEGQIVILPDGIVEFQQSTIYQMASSHCKETDKKKTINIPFKWEYLGNTFVYTELAWPPVVPFTVDTTGANPVAILHQPARITYKQFNIEDYYAIEIQYTDGKRAKYRDVEYEDKGISVVVAGKEIAKKDLKSFHITNVPREVGEFTTGSLVGIPEIYKRREGLEKIKKYITDKVKVKSAAAAPGRAVP